VSGRRHSSTGTSSGLYRSPHSVYTKSGTHCHQRSNTAYFRSITSWLRINMEPKPVILLLACLTISLICQYALGLLFAGVLLITLVVLALYSYTWFLRDLRKERVTLRGAARLLVLVAFNACAAALVVSPVWILAWVWGYSAAATSIGWNSIYIAPIVFFARPDKEQADSFSWWVIRTLYDFPLHCIVMLFGHPSLTRDWRLNRLATPLWHGVALGSLPFKHDVLYLAQTFGVRLVVNTCLEWEGHPRAYSKAGIS